MHKTMMEQAGPGDNIGFNVRVSAKELKRGFVAGDVRNDPPTGVKSFEAQVIVLDHPGQIMAGYQPVLDCHTSHIACKFNRLLCKVDKRTGQKKEDDPKALVKNEAGMVEMIPSKPMVVEPYALYPPLGRFAVRDLRKTIAVGVIKSTVREDKDGNLTNHGERSAKSQAAMDEDAAKIANAKAKGGAKGSKAKSGGAEKKTAAPSVAPTAAPTATPAKGPSAKAGAKAKAEVASAASASAAKPVAKPAQAAAAKPAAKATAAKK